MEINIGNKIRKLRKNKKLSIFQLSQSSGVSTGLISQIERDIVVPSVVSLWKISKVLDTNIGYYFDEGRREEEFVIRKENRKKILTNNNKAIYELLSPDLTRKIEFLSITLKGGEENIKESIVHEGEECGIVTKGSMVVLINGKEYEINEGDSIYFSSTLPHKYINNKKEDCTSIWAMTPPSF